MLLKITHQTDLTYSDPIKETVMELRMTPRQEQDQHRLSFSLGIGPAASAMSYFDWLGNTVHAFTIAPLHREVRILATSVLETDRPSVNPSELPDEWPLNGPLDPSTYDYLQFGGAVVDCPQLQELVRQLNPRKGSSLGRLILRSLDLIHDNFAYEKGVTTAASPITEILSHGRGVCQDFTHLMIGLARAMRIPSRYVSGFLHPFRERYRGYAQTHAWCEILFPSTGWIGFDPTNNSIVNSYFVKVGIGRDYRDVPPHKGLFKGQVQEKMNVTVHSEELPSVPMGLPAERLHPLPIQVFSTSQSFASEQAGQQSVQQQQQQRRMGGNDQQQQQQ